MVSRATMTTGRANPGIIGVTQTSRAGKAPYMRWRMEGRYRLLFESAADAISFTEQRTFPGVNERAAVSWSWNGGILLKSFGDLARNTIADNRRGTAAVPEEAPTFRDHPDRATRPVPVEISTARSTRRPAPRFLRAGYFQAQEKRRGTRAIRGEAGRVHERLEELNDSFPEQRSARQEIRTPEGGGWRWPRATDRYRSVLV
jgi:hypothetical protein